MVEKHILFHGTDCNPQSYWYPWLKERLKERGDDVEIPHYPKLNHEPIDQSLERVLGEYTFDDKTTLIGHSAGAPLILAILNAIDTPVKQAILVAGYVRTKGEETEPDSVLLEEYDWGKIRGNAGSFVFINSDNDPWGCNDIEGRYILDKVGKGVQVVMKGEGHMGSDSFNQPYREFPLLDRLIE
ncbi:MAG: alpha/beta hydrolase [Candidatus Levybacteria bacterium]|nr:alpha/beta hydrolase [Candidatus Levybacteria bacterium]